MEGGGQGPYLQAIRKALSNERLDGYGLGHPDDFKIANGTAAGRFVAAFHALAQAAVAAAESRAIPARVFHHEPIWHWGDLVEQHALAMDLTGWFSPPCERPLSHTIASERCTPRVQPPSSPLSRR